MEEIVVKIDKNGDVQVEGNGIVGPHCKDLTKDIERALGTVERSELKADYRQVRPGTANKIGGAR